MKPKFKTTRDGFEVIDPIDRQRFRIETNTPVDPTAATTDRIPYPTETAVTITTDKVTVPSSLLYVRMADGTLITELQPNEQTSLPQDEYLLDLSGPIKTYASLESGIEIRVDVERAEIVLDEPTSITLSARSHHTRPAATISTPADPTAVMEAVSRFGSALKTTTTERSYPALRGHPPSIERGDVLDIPDSLTRPETGIRIEVPPTLRHTFVVAPLAYYLAGKVVPASVPKLVTNTGFAYELDREHGFEETVRRVIKQVFLLDCIVRTEGSTPLSLYEREQLEPGLPFDIETVHGRSIAERLEAYLEAQFDDLEPHCPRWPETRLEPTADQIGFLSFIAADIATVSVSDGSGHAVATTPESDNDRSAFESDAPTVNDAGRTTTSLQSRVSRHCPHYETTLRRLRATARSRSTSFVTTQR